MGRRLGEMLVSREFLDGLNLSKCPRCNPEALVEIHRKLKLPANSRVVGFNDWEHFASARVLLRIECPDFKEIPQGTCPSKEDLLVSAMYKQISPDSFFGGVTCAWNGLDMEYFVEWAGPAVETHRIYGPDDTEHGSFKLDDAKDLLSQMTLDLQVSAMAWNQVRKPRKKNYWEAE